MLSSQKVYFLCELVVGLFFLKMNNICFKLFSVLISNMAVIDRCTVYKCKLFGVFKNFWGWKGFWDQEFEHCYGRCNESESRKWAVPPSLLGMVITEDMLIWMVDTTDEGQAPKRVVHFLHFLIGPRKTSVLSRDWVVTARGAPFLWAFQATDTG